MLILPLHKKPTRENFPVVTALILLINVLVFFVLQGGDGAVETEAGQYYHDSGLSAQEWEWFGEHISPNDQPHWDYRQELDALAEEDVPDAFIALFRANVLESHPDFLEAAEAGEFLSRDSEDWADWAQQREQFESMMDESFTQRYLLKYWKVEPANLFAHMFMHGSFMHLFGNMLFLVLLGLLVEGALGRWLYLGAYLLSGLGAAGATLLMNWGIPTGMLGASGAIAGLMGLFAVLYGLRKVRFFYWFFVYFDYVRAPALILLPAWLGWELLQFFMDDSNVAYDAHIGGIVTGALLGVLVLKLNWEDREFLDEEVREDDDRETLLHAREALSELRPDKAKRALRPLLERHGQDIQVLRLWYAACKLQAGDPERHEAAAAIFALPGRDAASRAFILETARDYLGQGRIRLRPAQLTSLAGRLAGWGETEEAQRLIRALGRMKQVPAGMADACLKLAHAWLLKGEPNRAGNCLALADRFVQTAPERQRIQALRRQL
ncbi:rhomboid family intramembrane serine protease [Natronospira bacteriovora]|uniref:Rhomboid family intramembrane serine protease n=1 Tax=Natronospira bacteriovora TaxID=3069753 RepID=A0ABU0W9U5_9GAMM|nr:rhomboid family intramembrane serine protease [Natronospira sp. AB-CW4]MDQ2070812.1 rhomboid family intramembrane serine protease [Natronospira sp. AB-CW4]